MIEYEYTIREKRENNQGFTIIELLIVIIVIGILSAISLPSFLNQANKARQTEAKTYIGSMNRAQQAAYMEQGSFTVNARELGLGIAPETTAYIYRIGVGSAAGSSVVNRAIPSDGSFSNVPGSQAGVFAYLGGVKAGRHSGTGEPSTLSIICEALTPPIVSGEDGTTLEPNNLASALAGPPACDTSVYRKVK